MRASNFDVGIIDLCWGECAHAFAANILRLPIIGYWPNSPGGANLGGLPHDLQWRPRPRCVPFRQFQRMKTRKTREKQNVQFS